MSVDDGWPCLARFAVMFVGMMDVYAFEFGVCHCNVGVMPTVSFKFCVYSDCIVTYEELQND